MAQKKRPEGGNTMSIGKVIETLETEIREYKRMIDARTLCLAGESAYEECQSRIDFDYEIIALLRTHPDAQPNEPLTLAELREMDGKPVYVMCDDGTYCWGLVSAGHGKVIVRDQYGMSADVVIWMPRGEKYYRRPPKEDKQCLN